MPCCGPEQLEATWLPCDGSPTVGPISGYAGMESREQGDQECVLAKQTWTTTAWEADNWPALGESINIEGTIWFVDGVRRSGCTVVFGLCRPILHCPDCTGSLIRIVRGPDTFGDCTDELFEQILATTLGVKLCGVQEQLKVVNDAEQVWAVGTLCLDTTVEVEPGDIVRCVQAQWRVQRVVRQCSAHCLLTIEAVREAVVIPQYISVVTHQLGSLSMPGTGTHVDPVYLDDTTHALGGIAMDVAGVHVPPQFAADAVHAMGGITMDAAGTNVDIGFNGEVTHALGGISMDGTGTMVTADFMTFENGDRLLWENGDYGIWED